MQSQQNITKETKIQDSDGGKLGNPIVKNVNTIPTSKKEVSLLTNIKFRQNIDTLVFNISPPLSPLLNSPRSRPIQTQSKVKL
jgi:hypothetical protein